MTGFSVFATVMIFSLCCWTDLGNQATHRLLARNSEHDEDLRSYRTVRRRLVVQTHTFRGRSLKLGLSYHDYKKNVIIVKKVNNQECLERGIVDGSRVLSVNALRWNESRFTLKSVKQEIDDCKKQRVPIMMSFECPNNQEPETITFEDLGLQDVLNWNNCQGERVSRTTAKGKEFFAKKILKCRACYGNGWYQNTYECRECGGTGELPDLTLIFEGGLREANIHVLNMNESDKMGRNERLTNVEAVAINLYTQQDADVYSHLNANLRKYHGWSDSEYKQKIWNEEFVQPETRIRAGNYQSYLDLFVRSCKKLKEHDHKDKLYRGLNLDKKNLSWIAQFKYNQQVTLVAAQSYSEDKSVARTFAKNKKKHYKIVFTLTTKKYESRAFDIESFSAYSESEVIVLPGTQVRVTKIREKHNGWIYIDLQEC